LNRKRTLIFAGIGLAMAAGYRVAQTCMVGILTGVHFRSAPVDFGAPPPRFSAEGFFDFAKENDYRAGTVLLAGAISVDEDQRKQNLTTGLQLAAKQEQSGDYPGAIATYRGLNRRGFGLTAEFSRRIALLRHAEAYGLTPDLKKFLSNTAFVDPAKCVQTEDQVSDFLKPYVCYQAGAELYDSGKLKDAAQAFETCSHRYPKSELAESAWIMSARSLLTVDDPERADVDHAETILQSFLSVYPHSRFRSNAIGWLGRCGYLKGDFAAALRNYEWQLSSCRTPSEKDSVYLSMIECREEAGQKAQAAALWLRDYAVWSDVGKAYVAVKKFEKEMSGLTAAESKTFRGELVDDPDLAASYFAIRLDLMNTKGSERRKLADLGREVVRRHPSASNVWARLAEMSYMDGDYRTARSQAAHGLDAENSRNDDWALCEFLYASTSMRGGLNSEAIHEFQAVSATSGYLSESAKETLAYLFDKIGDLDSALQQFYGLNSSAVHNDEEFSGDYNSDIAYLIDVKMTPSELQAMIDDHPSSPHRDEWIYSLGLRFLRKEQFREAEAIFARLNTAERRKFAGITKDNDDSDGPIQDPLQTTKDLAQLTFDATRGTDEQRAAALYEKASYYYERRGLLLYNYVIWQDARVMSVDDGWNDSIASARDVSALHDHEYEHECLVHAADLCKEVYEGYPRSKVAPNAIYRRACALEHLGNENEWWRWEGGRTHVAAQAADLLREIPKRYPHCDLAKDAAKYASAFASEAKDIRNTAVFNKWPTSYRIGWYGR
jgi:TolA-binding protein